MKKLFSRSLLALLLALCSTAGYAQKKVLCEDFGSTALPTGWTSSGNGWQFQDSEALFTSKTVNGTDTLITPLVSVADLKNTPTITMDYRLKASGSKVDQLSLLYRTATTEAWKPLAQFSEKQDTVTRVYTQLPTDVTGNVQIAVAVVYNDGVATAIGYLAIENKREVTEAPSNFRFEDLTPTGLTLYWGICNSDYFENNSLKISTIPIKDFAAKADTYDEHVQRFSATMTGLQPNTTYYAYVRYECEGEDFSPWAELSFTTPCEAITIPYSEDFENGLENCYTIIRNSRKTEVSEAYPHNAGGKSFQFLSDKGKDNYLFFPVANVDNIQDCQVTFYAASEVVSNTYSRDITIGVATDATAANFTAVNTVSLPTGRKWEHITISLAGYKGIGKVVVFKAGNANAENHIFIDDVTIERATTCPLPMFVNISSVTDNSARISWQETGNASEWNVVIATKQYTDPNDCEPDIAKGEYAGTAKTNPYEVKNLLPQTTYYVYVQPACPDADNWTEVTSFTTGKPITIPFTAAFDRYALDFYTENAAAIPEQWVVGARNINPKRPNYDKEEPSKMTAYISKAADHTNSAYVPASLLLKGTSKGTGDYYSSYVMLPAMPVDVNQLMVSFYAYSTTGTDTRIIVGVADVQSNDIETGKQFAIGGNVTVVDTLSFTLPTKTWEKFDLSLHNYKGKGRYITLYLEPVTSTPTVYIDDITVDYPPTCGLQVRDLKATPLGLTSFKATWKEPLKGTSWKIKVASAEIDPATTDGDVVKNSTVTSMEYECKDLLPNTTYHVYVSPVCEDIWTSTTVTTLYAITVPYYNDFTTEPTGSGKGPLYWTSGNMEAPTTGAGNKPYVDYTNWSNNVVKGYVLPSEIEKNSLYFPSATTARTPYVVLPELVGEDIKNLRISFWGFANATDTALCRTLAIGAMTDFADISTFEKISSIKLDTVKVPQYCQVDLSAYQGTGKFIAIYLENNTAKKTGAKVYIDNLSITKNTLLTRVTNLQVIDSTIKYTSAKLKWIENGGATSWRVRLFNAEQEDPSIGTPIAEYAATSTLFEVTGLKHSTQYFAYVQAMQGNEVGAWSLGTSFYTKCDDWGIPFHENFNSYAIGSSSKNTLPPCYEVESSNSSIPYVRAAKDAGLAHPDGDNVFYMTSNYSKKTQQWQQVTLPIVDKPINTLQMTMQACSYSTYFAAQSTTFIGVVTEDEQFHEVAKLQLAAAKVWEDWFVDFSKYTGENGRIAIRQDCARAGDKKTTYIYLANIRIVEIPQCLRVTEISVDSITTTSAIVSWKAADVEKDWNLKVSTKPLGTPSDEKADIFDGSKTETKHILSTLEPNTTYYVYVQSVRADKDCVGEWSHVSVFTTMCLPVASPYIENFDSYAAGIIPDCFTLSGDVTNTTAARTYSLNATTWGKDIKALYIAQTIVEDRNYCAFPSVECDSVNQMQLTMVVRPYNPTTTNASEERLYDKYLWEVGVMTDPKNPATFSALFKDSVYADGTKFGLDTYYSFEKYVGNAKGVKGKYIAIHVLPQITAAKGEEFRGSIYVDNVRIEPIVSCTPATRLRVLEFSNDTVRLTWHTTDKKGNFRVRLFNVADANPDTDTPVKDVVFADANTAVIKGLHSNTTYYAFVRKECSETDHSTWSIPTFWRTECSDIQSLPYVEDFETCTANAAPYCWTNIPKAYTPPASSETPYANAYVTKSAAKDGNLGLNLEYASQSGNYSYLAISKAVTPKLDIATPKDILLYFDVKAALKSSTLIIEAVESTLDDANAITIKEVYNISNSVWTTLYIDVADYYTSAMPYQYLRFRVKEGSSVYIDNVHITNDKSEVVPVQNIKAQDVSDKQATITFTEVTPSIKQWVLEYGAKDFALGSGTQITLDTTYVVLNNLTANTAYDVYVRAASSTAFTGPYSFSTMKTAATLPYHYNFGDGKENADLWTLYTTNPNNDKEYANAFTFGDAANVGGTGSTALYIQFEGKYGYMPKDVTGSTNPSSSWAARYVELTGGKTYKLGLKAKNPGNPKVGNENTDYLAVSIVPSTAVPSASQYVRADGTKGNAGNTYDKYNEFGLIPSKTFYGIDEYQEYTNTVYIPTSGTYQLLLYWYNSGVAVEPGDIYQPVAIDSIWMEEYACTTPFGHKLTNVTDSSATISWYGGEGDKCEIIVSRYTKSPRPHDLEETDMLVHDTYIGHLVDGKMSYTVHNLKPQTLYAIYQRAICPDGPSEWAEVDVTTNCVDEVLPYTELFAESPTCWTLNGSTAKIAKYRSEEMAAQGQPYEEWQYLNVLANRVIVLPDFGYEANRLAIRFRTFTTSAMPKIKVGVVNTPFETSDEDFVTVQEFQTTQKTTGGSSNDGYPYILEEFTAMLHRYTGHGHYIAIKPDAQMQIKDITVSLLPECVMPQQVEITPITETDATVNWLGGREAEWSIALDNDTFVVNENPYSLSKHHPLTQGTTYTVSVRANCDEEHQSEWTIPVTFTTVCGTNSLPLVEDFSDFLANENLSTKWFNPNCWEQKYTSVRLDSVVHRTDASKLFTSVVATDREFLKWSVRDKDWIEQFFGGIPHLESRLYQYWDPAKEGPYYKWLFTPKYQIEDSTLLTFQLAVSTVAGRKVKDITGVLNVAVTADGGKTFSCDSVLTLSRYDSVFTAVQLDMSKYKGKAIQVVFNHAVQRLDNRQTIALRLQNIQMRCVAEEHITATCYADCGRDYTDYGFNIPVDSLPKLGETKYYERIHSSIEGCDMHYYLTLTAVQSPSVATITTSICEGEYFEFGDHRISKPAPNGQPLRLSAPIAQSSCDSVVYLYLTVNKMQPAIQKTVVLSEAQLPWTDPDNPTYVIPIGATGTFQDTMRIGNTCQDCHYSVTIYPCVTVHTELPDTAICRGEFVLFDNKPYYPAQDTMFSAMKKQHDGCDSLITWHVKVNPVYSRDINVTICEGDSFLLGDTVLTTVGNYAYNFESVTGCDSIVTAHIEVIPVKTTSIVESICEGQSFRCAGEDFTESGSYERTLTSLTTGCDSIITLLLTVTPAPVVSQAATFCEGGTYDFNGTLLNKAGIYRDTTFAEKGCMSITELTLSMNPIKRTSLGTKYINKGETYEFFGEPLTATGSYSDTLQSVVTGCDSIISVNLIVLENITGHESMTVCANELPVVWKGQTITTEGVHQFDTLTTVGTDSIVLLSLDVIAPVAVDVRESVCEGGKYQFGDTTLTTAGTYTRTIPSLLTGCDSVITLHLAIIPANVETREANICNGGSYDFNGKLINRAGIYRDTVRSVDGCMNITELILAVNNSYNTIIYESICQGGKYQFGDTTLTTAGTYTRTYSSLVTGCDSTVTLVLTLTPAAVERKSVAICEGDAYDFNGKKLVAAGVYRDTVRSEEGCMSITELALTVNKPVSTSITETICEGIKYPLADTVVTTAGTHVRTTPSLLTGCDSTITLTLYVIPAEVAKATIPICEGHPYDFNGKLLSKAGTYRDTTYTKDGCMAISEVEIVVNKPVAATVNKTICEGSKYQFVDTILTTAGTYYRTTASKVTGCDSVITLNLTITPAPVEKVAETICEGATHQLGSKSLTTTGIYRDTTTVEGGCMSITELTLTVTPAPVENKTAEICEDATFDFAGQQLNTAGTYRDTTYAAETHCMTITELILTVNEIATINVDTTIHIEELPFVYKVNEVGYMILPENTAEGAYEMDTILVPGSCTSYHFNITVKTADAVDNIDVPSLHIYPTLINKGQSVNLILDAVPAANNVVVEIHDMVGQLVATYRPTSSHVVLGNFHTAGMYFVRVLTDDTVSGVGRVVVK